MRFFWEVLAIEHVGSWRRYHRMAVSIIDWTFLCLKDMAMVGFGACLKMMLVFGCAGAKLSKKVFGRRSCFILISLLVGLNWMRLSLARLFMWIWSLLIEVRLVDGLYCRFCFLFRRSHHFICGWSSIIFLSF